MKVESVRGMRDVLPAEADLWQDLEREIHRTCGLYAYREIRPPLVELAELFARGVGHHTDIVHKEMYVFPDRKGLQLALRPEATASVVRAYVEHSLHSSGDVVKLYYLGPMFRYEKPQKGRQRQFHQYGVEALGSLEPALDAEVIDIAAELVASLGLSREGLTLRLNSIGCARDRPAYRAALSGYLREHLEELCADCRRRVEENPMRVLDCKRPGCSVVAAAAPHSAQHLCSECAQHYREVKELLDVLGLAYEEDFTLVRGLDYYTRTVFELCSAELGAQDALLGGGRYDELVELLGGSPTPAVGFAGGMERLVLLLKSKAQEQRSEKLDVCLIPVGDEPQVRRGAVGILRQLRSSGRTADMEYMDRSVRKAMQVASRRAHWAVILGPEEIGEGQATVRHLASGTEARLDLGRLGNPDAWPPVPQG
ncbi:MAG: histidine--tRNA ligase [Candidatus Bipolaricaulota bacterium]